MNHVQFYLDLTAFRVDHNVGTALLREKLKGQP
jgi:hypothetical protein